MRGRPAVGSCARRTVFRIWRASPSPRAGLGGVRGGPRWRRTIGAALRGLLRAGKTRRRDHVPEVDARTSRRLVVHETPALGRRRRPARRIPCTSVERTIFDLGRGLGPRRMLDRATRADACVATPGRDATQTAQHRGTRLATRAASGGRRLLVAYRRRRRGSVGSGELLSQTSIPSDLHRDRLGHGKVALVRDSARRDHAWSSWAIIVVLSATAADLRDDGRRLAEAIRAVRDGTSPDATIASPTSVRLTPMSRRSVAEQRRN